MTRYGKPSENEDGKPDAVLLRPGLYIISTPIGNLRDITLRALDTLAAVDVVICEDTRVSGKLLDFYGLKKPLHSYNDHNAAGKRDGILEKLQGGGRVALISDAGTPLVSDPGYKLVRECFERGIAVTSLPGANAPLTALQLSGLPSDAFSFIGFLPNKSGARKKHLEEWKNVPGTLLAFETGPRLEGSLADIEAVLGNRDVAVVREMTKMFEESRRGSVSELLAHYKEKGAPKGEIVIVMAPPAVAEDDEAALEAKLRKALKTMSTKEAATFVADMTGAKRKVLYEMALRLSK